MWVLSLEENNQRTFTNSTTGGKCIQNMCYLDKEGNSWWEFADLMTLPFTRNFAATKVSSLYALGLSKDDLTAHTTGLKTILKSSDPEKYEKAFALVLDFESKANNATDAVRQVSSMVCVYFTLNNESIDSFEGNLQLKKMSILENDPDAHNFFLTRWIEIIEDYSKHLALLSQIVSIQSLPTNQSATI